MHIKNNILILCVFLFPTPKASAMLCIKKLPRNAITTTRYFSLGTYKTKQLSTEEANQIKELVTLSEVIDSKNKKAEALLKKHEQNKSNAAENQGKPYRVSFGNTFNYPDKE